MKSRSLSIMTFWGCVIIRLCWRPFWNGFSPPNMPPLVEPPNLNAEDMSVELMSEFVPSSPLPCTWFWDWFRRPPDGPDAPCSPPPCIMVPGCEETCDVVSENGGSSCGLFDDGFEAKPAPMKSLPWPVPVAPLLRTPAPVPNI